VGILDKFRGHRNGVRVVEYASKAQEVKLVPLGDVHLGSPTCQIKHFLGTVEYIRKSGSLVVLMGDW